MPVFDISAYAFLFIVLAAILASAIRILREYERGVLFTLGRFTRVSGPGLIIVIPVIQQIVRTDLRTFVEDVPSQDVISRDNVSVKVNAVIYFRIVDPERAVIAVENYREATSQLAQTTLRSVGHQGCQCRDQACRYRRKHGARDRPAGRGGAAAPREDHQCRGRAAGRGETGGSGQNSRQ